MKIETFLGGVHLQNFFLNHGFGDYTDCTEKTNMMSKMSNTGKFFSGKMMFFFLQVLNLSSSD
jgi:hypothetical protein